LRRSLGCEQGKNWRPWMARLFPIYVPVHLIPTLMHRRATSGGLLSYIKDVDPALAQEISDTVPGLREHLA
jgi:hypothetical protein